MKSTGKRTDTMAVEMPLFPLETVLFPGMLLPLHIFEPRYREMISRCVDEQKQFGVVLIEQGTETDPAAKPFRVGTAARIKRVQHLPGGKMDITVVGTQRFRVAELNSSRGYLLAQVHRFPVVNASTRLAEEMARKVRPRILEYVELLSDASNTKLRLDRLPEDPKALSLLVAIALQVSNHEKQRLLELTGVPEILNREHHLLSVETMLLRHMLETQSDVERLGMGSTGYVFPN